MRIQVATLLLLLLPGRILALEQLPVIFLTAKNQAEDVVTGLALGANFGKDRTN